MLFYVNRHVKSFVFTMFMTYKLPFSRNRAFHEQKGLDNTEDWIGEENNADVNESMNSQNSPNDRMDVIKAKEAESAYERRDDTQSSVRGRSNSESDIGDTNISTEMKVFRTWNDGERPPATNTIYSDPYGNDYSESMMGGHRDASALDLVMNFSRNQLINRPTEQGKGVGNTSSTVGRSPLRSSLYVCPKCDEQVASLDDLQVCCFRLLLVVILSFSCFLRMQVHVLCNHPDAIDLLAVFS